MATSDVNPVFKEVMISAVLKFHYHFISRLLFNFILFKRFVIFQLVADFDEKTCGIGGFKRQGFEKTDGGQQRKVHVVNKL